MDADAQADRRRRLHQAGRSLAHRLRLSPNGLVRMFQAVSLEADADDAKLLAFSAGSLIEGVKRIENAKLELTAIVEPIRLARRRRRA